VWAPQPAATSLHRARHLFRGLRRYASHNIPPAAPPLPPPAHTHTFSLSTQGCVRRPASFFCAGSLSPVPLLGVPLPCAEGGYRGHAATTPSPLVAVLIRTCGHWRAVGQHGGVRGPFGGGAWGADVEALLTELQLTAVRAVIPPPAPRPPPEMRRLDIHTSMWGVG
jgi:hypothetical protein